jgi:hypothetical protein
MMGRHTEDSIVEELGRFNSSLYDACVDKALGVAGEDLDLGLYPEEHRPYIARYLGDVEDECSSVRMTFEYTMQLVAEALS